MEDTVEFAVPMDVSCSLCNSFYLLGCTAPARKRILSVSQSGLVTWLFTVSCAEPLCDASLEFATSSDPSRNTRFVTRGNAVTMSSKAQSKKRPERVFVGKSCVASSSRCSPGESKSEEGRALELLLMRQSRIHSDNAATADVMQACLAERWDATPSKHVARVKIGNGVKRRKDAIAIAKRVKEAARAPPLAGQCSAAGRLSRPEFAAARLAVRSLHRGGALRRVVSACREAKS